MLRQHLPQTSDLPVETECEWNGQFWRISGRLIHIRQEALIALRLKKSNYSIFSRESGVSLSNQKELQETDVQSASIPICVGSVSTTIEAYSATPFPVLLLGEEGTGKDYAAIQLYRSGQNRQNALITIDCQVICKKRWKQLLESEDSPLLNIGLTFYFKNLDHLSDEQAEKLFRFMENSCAYRRNRCFFPRSITVTIHVLICRVIFQHLSCTFRPCVTAVRISPVCYRSVLISLMFCSANRSSASATMHLP